MNIYEVPSSISYVCLLSFLSTCIDLLDGWDDMRHPRAAYFHRVYYLCKLCNRCTVFSPNSKPTLSTNPPTIDPAPPRPPDCLSPTHDWSVVFYFSFIRCIISVRVLDQTQANWPLVWYWSHAEIIDWLINLLIETRQTNRQQESEWVCYKASVVQSVQGGAKNGATLPHCIYSENSITELRWNWWTSAILYAEHSH